MIDAQRFEALCADVRTRDREFEQAKADLKAAQEGLEQARLAADQARDTLWAFVDNAAGLGEAP